MKLESQVCSLELAKKLRGLGVKQESLFDWVGNSVFPTGRIDFHLEYGDHNYDIYYAAFTVAELGEMLPAFNPDSSPFQQLHCVKNRNSKGDEFSVFYQNNNRIQFSSFITFADTEADARAKMLIYLLENKLTPASQDKE